MKCAVCASTRMLEVQGKCSDRFGMWDRDNREYLGYVPSNLGIGGNDNIEFMYCLDCGHIRGEWPISEDALNEHYEEEEDDE